MGATVMMRLMPNLHAPWRARRGSIWAEAQGRGTDLSPGSASQSF